MVIVAVKVGGVVDVESVGGEDGRVVIEGDGRPGQV